MSKVLKILALAGIAGVVLYSFSVSSRSSNGDPPPPVVTKSSSQESQQMVASMPVPVARLVEAVNRGDTDAFVSLFPVGGRVIDWGRRFDGHAAIRRWSEGEFTGANGTLTPNEVSVSGDTVTVDAGWKSSVFSGDSRFVFVLDGEQILEMRIVAH